MSRKRKNRRRSNGHAPATTAVVSGTGGDLGGECGVYVGLPAQEVSAVFQAIKSKRTKSALKRAKALHKQADTAQSEAVLVEAYAARIVSMRAAGMTTEAKALVEMVESRYAAARGRFDPRRRDRPEHDPLHSLLGELATADLPPRRLQEIERTVRQTVWDPTRVSRCESLAADHPLRRAAAAIAKALDAVTRRTVDDAELALPEVSRRSPLAPWKLLVRAIACFYRGEDERCGKLLAGITADAAPARLVGAVGAMLAGRRDTNSPGWSELARLVAGGENDRLRRALAELDDAIDNGYAREILPLVGRAVKACKHDRPERLERLKQRISFRCMLAGLHAKSVARAMGGPSLRDEHFWRLMARSTERDGSTIMACAMWDEFRRYGVAAGVFADRSPQTTAVYLHMIDLLSDIPSYELTELQAHCAATFPGFGNEYKGQPASIRALAPPAGKVDTYFLYPDRIFKRICSYETWSEVYERWLAHAQRDRRPAKQVDSIAMKWHAALPDDARPLLRLAASAEKRKAFTKALKFLHQAEQCDALSPEVKKARLRLLVAAAMRHLKQAKIHLAEKDFAQIEELPQSRDGDRPALLAAMRCFCAELAGQQDEANRYHAEVTRLLDERTARILVVGVRKATEGHLAWYAAGPNLPPEEITAAAVGRCCAICGDLDVRFDLAFSWPQRLVDDLRDNGDRMSRGELMSLAASALRSKQDVVTYFAAGVGLRLGGPMDGRFLLLRAQSLPPFCRSRKDECLLAVIELARRRRDMDLVAEAADLRRRAPHSWGNEPSRKEITAEQLDAVLEHERQTVDFPAQWADEYVLGPSWEDDDSDEDDFPPRRDRSQGWPGPPTLFDDFLVEDEDEDEDEDFFDEELEDGFPFPGPFGDHRGGPPELGPPPVMVEIMLALMAETGGHRPTSRDITRFFERNPKYRNMLEEVMEASGLNDPFSGPPPPGGPGRERKSRKKRRR